MADPDPELVCTAYHEAGHAVARFAQDLPILEVSIIPSEDGATLGHCLYPRLPMYTWPEHVTTPAMRHRIEREIIASFAGYLVQQGRCHGKHDCTIEDAHEDHTWAVNYILRLADGDLGEVDPYLAWLMYRASRLVEAEQWGGVIADLAAVLLDRRRLGGRRVRAIIRGSLQAQTQALAAERPPIMVTRRLADGSVETSELSASAPWRPT